MPRVSGSLAPFLGQKATQVSDHTLGGTYLRGGFNVMSVGGEWWCRQGESRISADTVRYASTPWWWILDGSSTRGIIANPYWALLWQPSGCTTLYGPAINESLAVVNGSTTATSATTRVVNQLVLVNGDALSATDHVYRIVAVNGTTVTLERPFEGTTGSYNSDFIDPLPRDTSGTAASYGLGSGTPVRGSAIVFEQLVTYSATDVHAASPATTAGNQYLIITSEFGMPVAIDLTNGLAGTPVAALRTWFYNTALATPTQIPSNTYTGLYAQSYKDRLIIAQAPDPNGAYGDRTIWWSKIGDFLRWEVGISGQTAAPSFKTFSGVQNPITMLAPVGDDIVVHRKLSQEVGSLTQSAVQPFSFRTNAQGLGISDRTNYVSNRCITANGVQFILTQQGPAIFDGNRINLIARDAFADLVRYGMIRAPFTVDLMLHDSQRGLIYLIENGTTNQDATASTSMTTLAGTTYLSRCTAWVYDYFNDVSWFEDHPGIYGGGMSEVIGRENVPVLIVSRFDGTLIKMSSGDVAKDASLEDPGNTDTAVVPDAQVNTPWVNFGNNARKTIAKVEVVLRLWKKGSANASFDYVSDVISDAAFFRMRIYGDFNETETLADVDDTYDPQPTGATLIDNKQEPLILLRFTPKCSARTFKFKFSNALTAAATAAGYDKAPFRIHDVLVYFAQHESQQANTYAND